MFFEQVELIVISSTLPSLSTSVLSGTLSAQLPSPPDVPKKGKRSSPPRRLQTPRLSPSGIDHTKSNIPDQTSSSHFSWKTPYKHNHQQTIQNHRSQHQVAVPNRRQPGVSASNFNKWRVILRSRLRSTRVFHSLRVICTLVIEAYSGVDEVENLSLAYDVTSSILQVPFSPHLDIVRVRVQQQ